jgi:hypothetical protein
MWGWGLALDLEEWTSRTLVYLNAIVFRRLCLF